MAKEIQKPPYYVINNIALQGICLSLPSSLDDLMEVPGMGEAKVNLYGMKVLDLIGKKLASAAPNTIPEIVPPSTVRELSRVEAAQSKAKNAIKKQSAEFGKGGGANGTIVEAIDPLTLTEEQRNASQRVLDGNCNFFVTGSAGFF